MWYELFRNLASSFENNVFFNRVPCTFISTSNQLKVGHGCAHLKRTPNGLYCVPTIRIWYHHYTRFITWHGSFLNSLLCEILLAISRTSCIRAKTSFGISSIPFSSRFTACNRSAIHFTCVSLPTIVRFRFDLGPVINAGSRMFLLLAILHSSTL